MKLHTEHPDTILLNARLRVDAVQRFRPLWEDQSDVWLADLRAELNERFLRLIRAFPAPGPGVCETLDALEALIGFAEQRLEYLMLHS